MSFGCKIILDSIAPSGGRLTTFEVTLPRIVLAEFNTHRIFSRNSASSRAIPVEKMMKRVREDPFVPEYWGKNQKGMQAEQELDEKEIEIARRHWVADRDDSLRHANDLLSVGVHKQLANRLLEPHLWHTIIVSATEWSNFFGLRNNPKAQPEIRKPAWMMHEQYLAHKPQQLASGAWHLPLVTNIDEATLSKEYSLEQLIQISAARCARVSYLTHDGTRDPQKDLELYADLLLNGHMSPFEHPAKALSMNEWDDVSRVAYEQWRFSRVPVGNYWGFLQHRKVLPNEHDFGRIHA
jgi:thymidylate synthase ThyX